MLDFDTIALTGVLGHRQLGEGLFVGVHDQLGRCPGSHGLPQISLGPRPYRAGSR